MDILQRLVLFTSLNWSKRYYWWYIPQSTTGMNGEGSGTLTWILKAGSRVLRKLLDKSVKVSWVGRQKQELLPFFEQLVSLWPLRLVAARQKCHYTRHVSEKGEKCEPKSFRWSSLLEWCTAAWYFVSNKARAQWERSFKPSRSACTSRESRWNGYTLLQCTRQNNFSYFAKVRPGFHYGYHIAFSWTI